MIGIELLEPIEFARQIIASVDDDLLGVVLAAVFGCAIGGIAPAAAPRIATAPWVAATPRISTTPGIASLCPRCARSSGESDHIGSGASLRRGRSPLCGALLPIVHKLLPGNLAIA